jgi:hypothetical protein
MQKSRSADLSLFLSDLEDFRRGQGLRYPLPSVIAMIIMAIISGHNGYREFSRFMKANESELVTIFHLKHGVPSHVTIREILRKINLEALTTAFAKWMESVSESDKSDRWLAIDGKSLRSTITHEHNALQNFVNVVSIYAHGTGLVHAVRASETKKSYEPETVRKMIEQLNLKEYILTLDALHCQKKQ